jgi:hypothetical protein
VTLIFLYTTGITIWERPEGLKIAALFILAIVVTSIVSRLWRATELRATSIEVDDTAQRFIAEASRGTIRIIANEPQERDTREYYLKTREQIETNRVPEDEPLLFLEVTVCDASDFASVLKVKGEEVGGYRVLRAESTSVANAIAAFALYLRDQTGKIPHVYFAWSEGNPLGLLLRYLVFGEGDIPPVVHEILREAEPDPQRRPAVHVS